MRSLHKYLIKLFQKELLLVIATCSIFAVAYITLSVVKHNHFLSGYDLAIADQATWKYSQFKNPISTIQTYYDTSILNDHIELIYLVFAPFYWLYSSSLTLLILQAIVVCVSGIPVFLLARKKGIGIMLSFALLISYLSFYGIQNAIWNDVHSLVFGVSFLAWFIYFLETNNINFAFLFFILAIICKEDIAYLASLLSLVIFLTTRRKIYLIFLLLAALYSFLIFFVYFPHFTRDGYRYANPQGILHNMQIQNMINTPQKRSILFYSLGWYGFIPISMPIYLIPALGDAFHYFVLGNTKSIGNEIFGHYQVALALFMVWPTIHFFTKQKKYHFISSFYLIFCAMLLQYYMHLPLSYLTKQWFWKKPASVVDITSIITQLPKNASVVTQLNIAPHITHRDEVFLLMPTEKTFIKNSPCREKSCRWFSWGGNPQYLIIDIADTWDLRHFLIHRDDFILGINNLEKADYIKKKYQSHTSILYTIIKNPQKD